MQQPNAHGATLDVFITTPILQQKSGGGKVQLPASPACHVLIESVIKHPPSGQNPNSRPRQIVVVRRIRCKIRSKDIKGKRIGCRKAKIVHQALRVHVKGIKVTRSMHQWVPSLRVVTR